MRFTAPRIVMVVVIACAVAVAGFAQDDQDGESAGVMAPGDIDIGLSGGLGGLIYPHLTPKVDVGAVPLGSSVLSAGGSVDAGYCVLCSLVTTGTDWSVRSFYVTLLGRAMFHLENLASRTSSRTALDP